MKLTFITLFLFTISTCLAQKQNIYFLKNDGVEVQTRDSADFIRIVREPDSGSTNFKVLEYYKNGKAKFLGESSSVEPLILEESAISYFPNGKRSAIEQFTHGVKKASSTYYSNGKPQAMREYPEALANTNKYKNFTLITYYDTTGKALVVDGNGDFAGYEIEMDSRYAEGKIVNGKKEGTWKGNYPTDKINFIEEYHDGNLLTGTCITEKNKKYTYHTEVALLNVGVPDGPTLQLAQASNVVPEPVPVVTTEIREVTTTTRLVRTTTTITSELPRSMSPGNSLSGAEPNIADLQQHGTVIVSFTIDKNGRLTDLKIRKSLNENLDKSALQAVTGLVRKKANDKPAILLGKPIETRYILPINY